MIDFQPLTLGDKERYEAFLLDGAERGCEYSFANLYLWGRQRFAMIRDHIVLFSQFSKRTVYPYPVGSGDKKPVLDAIMEDAAKRGIPCRITGLNQEDIIYMEQTYPGQFRFHCDRDSYDYVYDIHDLADLKGRKYQKKRNHINRFRSLYPNWRVEGLSHANLEAVQEMAADWYKVRQESDPQGNYELEKVALSRLFAHFDTLKPEGLVLYDEDVILAFTVGSFLSEDTIDVHFEKAREDADGAYTAINQAFAQYLRDRYPQVRYLDREEDMGLEGLRKAKLSYYPHHLTEKYWARLWEESDEI